ncbi:hypothetical protein N7493_005421 [Penicillium malachiteum]|uniref:Uncharacterized protein n=1 Tax=Penicillium malachiteum TaxID=1324776 RepID=A0AAD6MWK8_9EURO|nr:hypothetical protein N7493_005421 [Penicillium malachiteum]
MSSFNEDSPSDQDNLSPSTEAEDISEVASIDYDKLASLCNVASKSAGNRWVSLRKNGLKIKGFYGTRQPPANHDAI